MAAGRKGYHVCEVYCDAGISGRSAKKREAFNRLIRDGQQQQFSVVAVWSVTRFGRNLVDTLTACDTLEQRGVYLESVTEGFDSRAPVGRMVRAILASVAQWESEIISENVRAASYERAMQGHRTCPYVLGYNTVRGDDSMTINPAEATIVRIIYMAYLWVQNIRVVCDLCERMGVRGKKGGKLRPESIHKILTRPIYCGYYTWHRQPIKGGFPPILPVWAYNRVQDIIARRGERYGRRRRKGLVWLPDDDPNGLPV